MYAIDLMDTDGTVVDTLPVPVASVRGWSDRINAPGKLVFSLNRNNPAASDDNLRKWRPVRLYRKPIDGTDTMLPTWFGYLMASRENGERVEVQAQGGLKIFTKREATGTFTGAGSTEAFGLLSTTNSLGVTGISQGTGGVTTTMDMTLSDVQMLHGLEQFGMATGGEFRVNPDAELDFVPGLGSDMSHIELIFDRTGNPSNNLSAFEIAEDGEPMANRILGEGGGFTKTYNHPTSVSSGYPLLVERKVFPVVNDQGTLDALTAAYGLQKGLPIPDFIAQPATTIKRFNPLSGVREISGLEYGDVGVGDLVTVTIITGARNTSTVKRIAELQVEVDENLNERLLFTFSEAGVYVTGQYLDDAAFADIRRRVLEIERQL